MMLQSGVLSKVMRRCLHQGFILPNKVSTGILFTASSLLLSATLSAQTISGNIGVDTLWDDTSQPYVVSAGKSISIDIDATLLINPGVTVVFENDARLLVLGGIVAVGTIESPITFGPSSTEGSWGGILFKDSADDIIYNNDGTYASGSFLEHIIITGVSASILVFAVDTPVNGAIDLNNAFPGLNFLTLQNNFTTGLYANFSNSNSAPNDALIISNSTIQGNAVSALPRSPGISIYDDSQTIIKIDSNKFSNNIDTEYLNTGNNVDTSTGGGLFISGGKQIEVTANTFTSNSAKNGGAINITNLPGPVTEADSDSLISNNMISENRAINGAGLYLINSVVKIANNQIIANASILQGAGIYTKNSTVEISNNLLLKNQATNTGGGIFIHSTEIDAKISNNTFYANQTEVHGGGLDIHSGNVKISNNTFTSNFATDYGDHFNTNGGTGSFTNNSVQGTGAGTLITLGAPYTISNNTIAANTNISYLLRVDITNTGSEGDINDNNFFGNTPKNSAGIIYILNADQNRAATANIPEHIATTVNAKMNWWGTTDPETIMALTDGLSFGVDSGNFLDSINTLAPISSPVGVFAAVTASSSGIGVNWIPNSESDISGYRVFWSKASIAETSDLRYSDSVDVGPMTSYTIPGDKLTGGSDYFIAVSAYDINRVEDYDLNTTLVNENVVAGNESWFSQEFVVSWGNDNAAKAGGNPGGGDGGGGSSDYWWLSLFGLVIVLRQLIFYKKDTYSDTAR